MTLKLKSDQKFFGYQDGNSEVKWLVEDIINTVKNQKVEKLQLGIFAKNIPLLTQNYDDRDYERCAQADISFPVIVSKPSLKLNQPIIVDGNHRMVKMFGLKLSPKTLIEVHLIDEMPLPFMCTGKPFRIPGLNFKWKVKPRSYTPPSRKANLFK